VAAGTETIEFRIFSGSTNFDKIYNAVLLSLAFTHLCNNHYKWIMGAESTTLADVVNIAYARHSPEIVERLLNYIEARKKKFNKTDIYKFYPVEFNTNTNANSDNPTPVANTPIPAQTLRATPADPDMDQERMRVALEEAEREWNEEFFRVRDHA
jgi:hypothetical protein